MGCKFSEFLKLKVFLVDSNYIGIWSLYYKQPSSFSRYGEIVFGLLSWKCFCYVGEIIIFDLFLSLKFLLLYHWSFFVGSTFPKFCFYPHLHTYANNGISCISDHIVFIKPINDNLKIFDKCSFNFSFIINNSIKVVVICLIT